MPLSNSDNPLAESPAKPAKQAKVSTPPPVASPPLAKAGSSGSAEVHGLLAKREIALSNGDADAAAAADAALAELGFTV